MNSRERLMRALEGKPTDRVPISTYEMSGYNSLSFENNQPSYQNMMKYIRTNTDCVCMWDPSSNQNFALSSYPVEIRNESYRTGEYHVTHQTVSTQKGSLTRTLKVADNLNTTWQTEHLCKNTQDVDAYLSIPYLPVQYNFSDLCRIQNEVGDHGILMASVADPACTAMEMMEFGQATVWALTETAHYEKTLEELHRRTMANLKSMLEQGVVDLYRIVGPEYITPPYLPPRFFSRFVAPYIKDMTQLIHRYGGKVRIHSHGKIEKVLNMILDSGADAIDPCEAPPDGDISLADIKHRVGSSMCIFGNIQLKLLEHGSREDVRQTVAACMTMAKDGGRYVIMPTASPINIPLMSKTEDNYMAFIDAALEFGKY
jgi:uroporphyrinogen-III decarboxylase